MARSSKSRCRTIASPACRAFSSWANASASTSAIGPRSARSSGSTTPPRRSNRSTRAATRRSGPEPTGRTISRYRPTGRGGAASSMRSGGRWMAPANSPTAAGRRPSTRIRRRRCVAGAFTAPVRTGVRVIDLFTPLCLGQRVGVFAGSGVGKSSLLAMLARAPQFDTVDHRAGRGARPRSAASFSTTRCARTARPPLRSSRPATKVR